MGTSSFAAGTHIKINGQEFQLLRMFADGADKAHPKWQIEEVRTKRIIEHSVQELQRLYSSGALVFPHGRTGVGQAHLEIDPEQLEVAKVRLAYVKAVLKLPASHALIKDTITEIWEKIQKPERPPSTSSVLRWKRRYTKAGNDIQALIERTCDMGNRTQRLPVQLLDIVKEAVERVYLTPEKNQITAVVDRARADVNEWNKVALPELKLPLPTRKTVRRIIDSISAFDRYAARHGRVAAVKKFRAVRAHRTTNAPLERAEIDHTQLDLMVIDDRTGLPLGRPYVTACIDDYTRCVLGIEIGFEPPGFLTVARCLKTAFMPKELTNLYPRVKNTWEAHGVMRELVVDNGAEFHSVSLENACYRLGIEIHYSARKTPWFKGKIERFLQTLNGAIAHGRPGTTFGNIFEKEEYDPSKHAVIRLSTLKEIAHIWIVDVYHQMPHRTLMDSPAAVWASSVALENILLPDDPAEMDAILGRTEHRKLTHRGIELDGLLYNSDDLTNLRMRLGDRLDVEIRVDDSDIGQISVLSPDKSQVFKVPALRSEYATGLSSWQHRVCKKFARDQLQKHDSSGWLEAKKLIAELIDNEFLHKKQKTRARKARWESNKGITGRNPAALPKPKDQAESLVAPTQPPVDPIETPIDQEDLSPTEGTQAPSRKFSALYRSRTAVAISNDQTKE